MQCPEIITVNILVNIFLKSAFVFMSIPIRFADPSVSIAPYTQCILLVTIGMYTVHSALQFLFT